MQELLVFQTYGSYDQAHTIAAALNANSIPTEVVQNVRRLDASIIGQSYEDQFILRIPAPDFPRANEILSELTKFNADDISKDDPLFKLTNDELLDVVAKPDEWGIDNYNVALALLEKRNVTIPDNSLSQMKENRIGTLSERKSLNPFVLAMGYLSCLLHFFLLLLKYQGYTETKYYWYFPGIFGLLLGAVILQSKTTLPNGKRFLTFNERVIRHGVLLITLGALAWLINLIAFMFSFS